MSFFPPIYGCAGGSTHPRTKADAIAAGAATNRRVSFTVPQMRAHDAVRPPDSVDVSATFSSSDHGGFFADPSGMHPMGVLEGRDCTQAGVRNGRFSLTSRSRLSSIGSTFHVADANTNVHIARRIWGGKVDNVSHGEMLQRVRSQFKQPSDRTHLPLVLPPQIPSSERAAVPQLPKFSRGIRQYKRVHGTFGFDRSETELSEDDHRDAAAWLDGDDAERAASAPPVLQDADGKSSDPIIVDGTHSDGEALVRQALQADPIAPLTAVQLESMAATAVLRGDAGRKSSTGNLNGVLVEDKIASTRQSSAGAMPAGLSTPLGWADSSARRRASSTRRASLMHVDSPLGALTTFQERWQRLRELEQLERLHIISTERWDRQVVVEMMVAHYVSFVLKPEMEELQARERMVRGFLSYEEEHERYELFNTHPLAKTLWTEVRALEAKKLKLTRIEQLQKANAAMRHLGEAARGSFEEKSSFDLQRAPSSADSAASGMWTAACMTREATMLPSSLAADAPVFPSAGTSKTSLVTTAPCPPLLHNTGSPQSAIAPIVGVLPATSPQHADAEATEVEGDGQGTTLAAAQADDARLILQRYARRKHALELKEAAHALNGNEDAAASDDMHVSLDAHPIDADAAPAYSAACRRASELVVPAESVAARAPRRNTVGIADYIALLDEDDVQRKLILESERAERNQIHALLQDELAVVMDWQRKRMHLERLLYWRQLREEQLHKEVKELTDLTDPRAIDPKTAVLLSVIEEGEEQDRAALEQQQTEALVDIVYWGGVLHVSATGDDLVKCYAAAQAAAWSDACAGFRDALQMWETAARHTLESEEARAWGEQVLPRASDVRTLYEVSVNPAQYEAVRTLQHYFKASLNDRLGRHYTNTQVGRDIQAARNARKIERGLGELRSFKRKLKDEEAAIVAEIQAEHAAQRRTLLDAEQRNRISLITEEEWSLAVVRKVGQRSVEDALLAWLRRLVKEEHEERIEAEVMEEMQRERLGQHMTAVLSTVRVLDALMEEENDRELQLTAEASVAWKTLLSDAYDARELIRLDAEDRARAMRASDEHHEHHEHDEQPSQSRVEDADADTHTARRQHEGPEEDVEEDVEEDLEEDEL